MPERSFNRARILRALQACDLHSAEEAQADVVLNFTTGGELDASAQERRRSLDAQPELATLNCGSINYGLGDPGDCDRGVRAHGPCKICPNPRNFGNGSFANWGVHPV